jgi:hypothetical protein
LLKITHSAAEGTMLEGTSKGDGAWDAIKAAQQRYEIRGWKYFPSIRAIGVSHSRDHAPKLHLIDATAEVLRAAGFEVEIEIDGKPRAMEEAEADRADRMDDRAAALTAKAERKSGEADGRQAAAEQIAERFAAGQPIIMNHHSTRGALRDRARIESNMRAAVQLDEEAKLAAERAATAERHMEARNNPRRVYRRIRTLEADLRDVQRKLATCRISGRKLKNDGAGRTLECPLCYAEVPGVDMLFPEHGAATGRYKEQLELNLADLTEKIRYWKEALDAAKAAGVWVPVDPADVKPGHWIKSWAGWNKVIRANKVSITVEDSYGPGRGTFPRKITLDDITAHRETSPFEPTPAEEAAAQAVIELDELACAAVEEPSSEPEPAVDPAPVQAPARTASGLSPEALAVLSGAAADHRAVWLAAFPSSREVLVEIEQAMARIGGRWDTRDRAYLFARDPREQLEKLTGVPALPPPSPARDRELSYWPTPPALAAEVAEVVRDLPAGARVLEPSAGDGALVRAISAARPDVHLTCVEVDSFRAKTLSRAYGGPCPDAIYCQPFEEYAAERTPAPFHAVVMNPPFTLPGDRLAWVTHLELAWSLLAEGGELRAIVPASLEFGQQKRITAIRELILAAGGSWRPAPEGAFRMAGTDVRTLIVEATR